MRDELIESIEFRIHTEIAPQNPLKYLKEYSVEEYINTVISIVYLYTRPKKGFHNTSIYLTEVISAIGNSLRGEMGLRRNSALGAKTGAFILYSFEELGMLEIALGRGKRKHASYVIKVVNEDEIVKLWENLPVREIVKLPSEEPPEPWVSTRHPSGLTMIKTLSKEVLNKVKPKTHPILFECINRSQAVGWRINDFIYETHLWALRNKADAFADIWEQQNPEAKATKLREAQAIGSIANKFRGKTFHHLYYYDFRGRKYPASAYLHEQGSDLAKSLLLREDKKPVGKKGFFWLMVSIASNWAGDAGREDELKTDKIPLMDRYEWATDNEEILLSYADSPKVNQGWMKADKPWQFLAACHELRRFRDWQREMVQKRVLDYLEHDRRFEKEFDEYGYESSLEVFIDGSNNGCQHLSALTRDEVTAPHVNLVPLTVCGDLYKYVAAHIWDSLEETVATYTEEQKEECEIFIDTLVEMKKQINDAEPRSDQRKELIEDLRAFKSENRAVFELSPPVFWLRIKDDKQKRKIVKRNTMTLPYGGTAYGLGEQQISDAKKLGIEQLMYMENKWAAFMGRKVFEDCKTSLKKPMQLLSIFEKAGKKAETEGRFLGWTVPVTNFPVVQYYIQGKVKKIWVQYGPPMGGKKSTGYYENTLQLAISFLEDPVPSKRKQSQGAAPNAIHSLDAAHLLMTVHEADFPVTTVHDSFGCLLADMPKLFVLTRETFVELYEKDPLSSLMEDIGGDLEGLEFGDLDIRAILDSEYCFA